MIMINTEELLELMNKFSERDREEMRILCKKVENSYASYLKKQVLAGEISVSQAEEELARLKGLREETFGGE